MIKSLFLSNNEIIKYPIVTDKATRLLENNKYIFIVNPKSDKFSIKSAIEELFGVTVLKINTSNLPRKKKRMLPYSLPMLICFTDSEIMAPFSGC